MGTKAEIEDIFGEFEIDEDYMIKTKDVISLFVAVKEEPKAEEPVVVEEAPVEEEEEEEEEGCQVKCFQQFYSKSWLVLLGAQLQTPTFQTEGDTVSPVNIYVPFNIKIEQ